MFGSPRRSQGCFRLLVWLVCMTSIIAAQVKQRPIAIPGRPRPPEKNPYVENGIYPTCPGKRQPSSHTLPPAPCFHIPRVCEIDSKPTVPGGVHVGALLRMHWRYDLAGGICPRNSFLGWDAVQQILVSFHR